MGGFVKGDVVIVAFPYSDLTDVKRRPALVLATMGPDVLLSQVTTRPWGDPTSVPLQLSDFQHGGLHRPSYIRPGHLFTAEAGVVLYRAGRVRPEKMQDVIEEVKKLLDADA